MKQITVTEAGGIKLGRNHHAEGDTVTLDDDIADMCVGNGWAKDTASGETGERKPGAHKIEVDSVRQKLTAL